MNLEEFVKDATRTESKIPFVVTNRDVLSNIISMFILSGQMLDQYKKNIFYKREINNDVLIDNFKALAEAMTNLSYQFKSNEHQDNNDVLVINPRIFHAVLGASTEATELMEQLQHMIETGEGPDAVNLLEEFFDINWYNAILHDELNTAMEHTLLCGIDKLRKRFPDKFTSEQAIHRDVDAEREILNRMVD